MDQFGRPQFGDWMGIAQGLKGVNQDREEQEALAIADRLAVMHAGQIVQVGDGETLYRAPTHPFVAQFLGRVNRLQRDAAASAQAVLMLGGLPLPCPAAVQVADGCLHIRTDEPQFPTAPGQVAAVYDEEGRVLAAGVVEEME